ncbi:MAG: gliding motility-associated C-terminal domain-containing protein, partial [Bacteroidales bacterium]|nr:gliding motility-associated C-terminal domain-containing protein [Bacteroidales bacterium]
SRLWSLTDDCGNTTTHTQVITIRDTISPTFTQPADITIYKDESCNYDASLTATGDVTDEADNCDTSLDAVHNDTVIPGACEGEEIISRLWSLTDDCGNTTTHTQVITIRDTISPTFTAPPDTVICRTLDCSYNISIAITGDVIDEADNCDTSLEALFSDDESGALDCNNLGLVVRTWTLTDDCGNATTHTQNIWIEPVVAITAVGDTLCDGDQTSILVESFNITNNGIRYTWTVTDNPDVEGESNSTGFGQIIGTEITETLNNTTDTAQLLQYTITPWTINNNGANECTGNEITLDIWVNPTPRVIPLVAEDRICSEDATEVQITSPALMTHGELKFDYIVSFSPGGLAGNSDPQSGLNRGDIISFPYDNNTDTVQSVYYSILPRAEGTGCAPGLRDTAEVKVHPVPLQELLISQHLTCDSNFDMELTAVVAKGTDPLDITWSGGPATFIPELWHNETVVYDLRGGIYSVTVTDNLGCETFDSQGEFEVSPDPAFYPLLKGPENRFHISCNGGEDGVIEFQCWDGENFPYYYWIVKNEEDTVWTDVLYSASEIHYIPNLGVGTYEYILRDDNGCFFYSTTSIELMAPQLITASYITSDYEGFNISCKGYNDGNISVVDVEGGNGYYEYSWGPDSLITGDNTLDHIENLPAGKYYLDIRDLLGCLRTDTIILTEPEGISPGIHDISLYEGGFKISCKGASDGYINLDFEGGSGGYTYFWTGPEGAALQVNERNQSGLIAGEYSVLVTDANGCTMPLDFTLTEPASLEIIFNPSLSPDGAFNINCNGGTGQIDITVTGGSITGYTYDWSSPDGGSGLDVSSEDQTGLSAAKYIVQVTDLNGCILVDSITLTEPPALGVVHEVTNITCESPGMDNGTITLTVEGGAGEPYSYLWSNGVVNRDLTGLTEGEYSVTVTDNYGCIAYDTAYISLPPPLEFVKDSSNYNGYGISCYGKSDGFINITMTSGQEPYVFTWTGPGGFSSTESSISKLSEGEYILTVEDINYCTVSDTTVLTQPDSLIMNLDISVSDDGGFNINCFGENSGSIEIIAENNVCAVDYYWTDGYMGSLRTGLPAGTYGVIMVDENSCNSDTVIELTQPDRIVINADIVQPFCKDMPDGEITLEVSGGIPAYSYLWYDNSTDNYKDYVAGGEYPVTVTDANGCSVTDTIIVTSEQEVCITIPNAISPNGDNINDVWNIEMIELYPDAEIKIFNRWGEMVWASDKGYPQPWDGTSKGRKLPIDSYHYIINLHDGTRPVIGDVTILR